MRLLKFKATNLFSLGDIEIDLDRRGLILITGHSNDEGGANGSGKSSLSNKGILWTLFGSTAAGERADAAINRFAPADATCSGILDVESNNGGKFRIIRSRNPNRLSLIDVAAGQDISARTEKETQVLINKILGRTRDTFLQTDFFGQGKQAAFLDLTPKAQVEVLETILPFDKLSQLSDSAKEFLSKLNVVGASVDRKLNEYNGKYLEAQRQERILSEAIDKWDTEHDQKIEQLQIRIKELEVSDFDVQLEVLKKRATELPNREECHKALTECEDYFKSLNQIEQQVHSYLALFRHNLNTLEPAPAPTLLTKSCPTCFSPIDEHVKDRIREQRAQYEKKLKIAQLNIVEQEQHLQQISLRRSDAFKREKEIEKAKTEIVEFEAQIAQLEARRNSGELAILRQSLADTQQEVNPYLEIYTQTCNSVAGTAQNLSTQKARVEQVQKDQQALTFWRDAFGKELKNEFLSQVCPYLEKRCAEHLAGLGNPQIKVSIGTRKHLKSNEDRSEFTVECQSSTGGGDYSSLSGGERQLVNFSVGLALADLAELQTDGPSYFMVLDEPFMALDKRNSENFVSYLNSYLNGKKETILLVSNEEILKTLIPNRVNVIKENGISRIE